MREQGTNGLFACPCCGYATISEPTGHEICPICFWEDDGQDDPKAEEIWGGPNPVSLTVARINFLHMGSSCERRSKNVRKPIDSDEKLRVYKMENGSLRKL
jgi:hypothetical protein